MPDILITENIVGPEVDRLSEQFRVEFAPDLWKAIAKLEREIGECEALIVRNQTQVTPDLLARAAQLRIIARAGAGLDNIDVDAATRQGIVVVSAAEQNSIS